MNSCCIYATVQYVYSLKSETLVFSKKFVATIEMHGVMFKNTMIFTAIFVMPFLPALVLCKNFVYMFHHYILRLVVQFKHM
jgi:hypothetical protein